MVGVAGGASDDSSVMLRTGFWGEMIVIALRDFLKYGLLQRTNDASLN